MDDKTTPTVRAKFSCLSVTPISTTDPTAGVAGRLFAVYGDGTDNASWSAATPGGQLDMSITNPAAAGAFVTGQDYYLDFTPVPAAPAPTSNITLDGDGGTSARPATVSADAGNLITTGSDGLPYLSSATIEAARWAIGGPPGSTVDPAPAAQAA